jgi:glutamate synthase (NADPH/NADH) small chain
MGKPTGFLEFDRVKEHYAPVEERVHHYQEFVPTSPNPNRRT